MITVSAFADVERLMIAFYGQQFPDVLAVTIVPAKAETRLPIIMVNRIGGTDTVPSIDNPLVDVECLAGTRVAAKDFAAEVRAATRYLLPGFAWSGASVKDVVSPVGPSERPYGNPAIFRFGMTHQVTLHNHQ